MQVLKRHWEEKHQPDSLIKCSHCNHKWTLSRKSEQRKHLCKKHRLEGDKIDKILGPRPPSRRRGKGRLIESDPPPPPHFSPPPIERDQQSLAEPQQRPLMLPLLADANHPSPPVISSVAYNPRLVNAEITTTVYEDSSQLKHHASTHTPPGLVSQGDSALLNINYGIHGGFFRFVHAYVRRILYDRLCSQISKSPPGGYTTANTPPNPGTDASSCPGSVWI
jgi:hypothetical protein